MTKISNEEKLKALKQFLRENKIRYIENHKSKTYGVTMDLKVRKLNIAVFLSDGDRNFEESIVFTKSKYGKPLQVIYNPFFIRESETTEYIIEKMQNCIVNRMMYLQRKWQKKQETSK